MSIQSRPLSERFQRPQKQTVGRVATFRESYLENEFFSGQRKVREFCGWSGKFRKDLESQGKVREFEKNGYGRQTPKNLFLSRGKQMKFLMR